LKGFSLFTLPIGRPMMLSAHIHFGIGMSLLPIHRWNYIDRGIIGSLTISAGLVANA